LLKTIELMDLKRNLFLKTKKRHNVWRFFFSDRFPIHTEIGRGRGDDRAASGADLKQPFSARMFCPTEGFHGVCTDINCSQETKNNCAKTIA